MITICGEALIDLVPDDGATWRAIPGGGPANTAIALARLDTPATLLCRLSGDVFGRRIREHLAANGVDLSRAVAAEEQTTLAIVDVDEHGGADYTFYLRGTADWQWSPGELPDPAGTDLSCVHVGSLAALLSPGAAVLRAWLTPLRGETIVSYDLNVRPAVCPDRESYRASVRAWLDTAHIVKASDDDLTWLHPDRDPLDIARAWTRDHGTRLVLLTHGADGATALLSGAPDPITVPAVAVDVADTVGAGDSFVAATLASLSEAGMLENPEALSRAGAGDIAAALRYGAAAAALTCTRSGARPPHRAELAQAG